MTETAALQALIAPVVAAEGFDLVRLQMGGGKQAATLQVMAEDPATGQLTLEQCARLSRAISATLDEADPIESEYRLEVSSPGIDRPLTRQKDWSDWAGHMVRVTLVKPDDGRKRYEGKVAGASAEAARIEVAGLGLVTLPFDNIAGAKLALTDDLIKATRPLSTEGADDFDDTTEED